MPAQGHDHVFPHHPQQRVPAKRGRVLVMREEKAEDADFPVHCQSARPCVLCVFVCKFVSMD